MLKHFTFTFILNPHTQINIIHKKTVFSTNPITLYIKHFQLLINTTVHLALQIILDMCCIYRLLYIISTGT